MKSDIKAIQIKILDKRNSINVVQEAQDFLIKLKKASTDEERNYAMKTFMRIIFKNIYIQNQKIVKLELNQPWKYCYEEGLKCQKTLKIKEKPQRKEKRNRLSFWLPTADRWVQYYTTFVGFLNKIYR
ncbi:MAG: hypothetical protein HQL26_11165 [Candidatus Omnitrophica bacterium]|nr:hypothetical protein [Candidatus Omnitrophota bacterium]